MNNRAFKNPVSKFVKWIYTETLKGVVMNNACGLMRTEDHVLQLGWNIFCYFTKQEALCSKAQAFRFVEINAIQRSDNVTTSCMFPHRLCPADEQRAHCGGTNQSQASIHYGSLKWRTVASVILNWRFKRSYQRQRKRSIISRVGRARSVISIVLVHVTKKKVSRLLHVLIESHVRLQAISFAESELL